MRQARLAAVPLSLLLGIPAALAPLHGGAQGQSPPAHVIVRPGDLKWSDVASLPPGAKMAMMEGPLNEAVAFTARVRFPANYRIPPHWHPAVEHVTVLSGTFHLGMGETFDRSRTVALPAGSFAVMPARTGHFVQTGSEPVEIQVHGTGPWGVTYFNPNDDPRSK